MTTMTLGQEINQTVTQQLNQEKQETLNEMQAAENCRCRFLKLHTDYLKQHDTMGTYLIIGLVSWLIVASSNLIKNWRTWFDLNQVHVEEVNNEN